MTHKIVPESPETMLPDLENIDKFFVMGYNEKANTNKAKVATASKAEEACMPNKCANGAHLIKALRRAFLLSIAAGARVMEGLT